MLCAPLAGRWAARHGPRPPVLAGMGLAAVAILALLRLEVGTSIAEVAWAFALLGVGTGLALPAMTVTALAAAPSTQAGTASAVHNASRQLGQTFAVAVLGTIILAQAGDRADKGALTGHLAGEWVEGLHLALVASAGALVAASLAAAILIPRGVLRTASGPAGGGDTPVAAGARTHV
jgi:DHA2 family methylenomycin A resistance protein-like MFS transporter